MAETWRPVRGYEGRYEISDGGRLRGLDRPMLYNDGRVGRRKGRILNGAVAPNGYRYFALDSTRKVLAHRLVADAFLPPPSPGAVINHKSGDKLDNRPENLEWGSYGHNNRHARETGLNRQHGPRCNLAKYSTDTVQAIRALYATGDFTYAQIASITGVSKYHVGDIVKRKTRRHA